jgi:hypothetical protein
MKRAAQVTSLLLGIYVLSYIALSLFGAYAPAVWGLNGVKWYSWAPPGFYDPATGNWIHTPLRIFYAPLSIADDRFWHTHYHPENSDPQHPVVFPGFKRK